MEIFKTYRLGDLVSKITKGTTPTTIGGRFTDHGINFIKSEAVGYDGRIDKTTFVFIDHETHQKLKRSQLQKDDILFSMAGIFLGKNALVTEDILPANTNQALAIIRIDQEKALPKFVHYYLRQPHVIKHINSISGQSAQPNINFDEIKSIEIWLPELKVQNKISGILSSLDDKIALNLQINQTLENLALAIFKEWFIDYRFPGYDSDFTEALPRGWERVRLGSVVKTVLGGTPSTTEKSYWCDGTIPWINSGKVNEFRIIEPSTFITADALNSSNTKLLPKGTTVIAITGATLGQVSRLEIESCANQSVVGIVENEKIKSDYIYLYVQHNIRYIIRGQTGGAQQHINKNDINNLDFILPTRDILEKFYKIVAPIFEAISSNCYQNLYFQKVIDASLPKLMSGELRVA